MYIELGYNYDYCETIDDGQVLITTNYYAD